MKIAFILTNYPTFGDTFITNQMTGLLKLGHEISIFANSPQAGLHQVHEDIVEFGLVHRAQYFSHEDGNIGSISSLVSDLRREKSVAFSRLVRVFDGQLFKRNPRLTGQGHLKRNFWRSSVFGALSIKSYFMLKFFEKEGSFDIINPHFGPVASKVIFLKQIQPGAKLVASFHGYDFSMYIRQHGSDSYRELFEKADLVTTHSFYARDCLIAIGCPAGKVIKHPIGVYTDKFAFRPRNVDPNSSRIRFIIVSRLVEKKGHRILLEAFARLALKCAEVELHIVGSGPEEQRIRQQIEASEVLRNRVYLHGWLTQDKIAEILDTCHIFVHPSVATMDTAEMEDTPTAIIEAQAMGLPVISTFHAGIPEIVEHGRSGILVPERNVSVLYDAMHTLATNPASWPKMGACGRTLVEKKFDIRILNKKLEHIFQKLRELPANKFINLESTEEIIIKDEQFVVEKVTENSFLYPNSNVCGGAVTSARQ